MKKIALGQGIYTLVDDKDFEWLNRWKWSASKMNNGIYASRASLEDNGLGKVRKSIAMHRLILDAPSHMFVDHIDGNTLNNCRGNLRLCTRAQNNMNRKVRYDSPSGYKGVMVGKNKKWRAFIRFNGHLRHLGYFEDPIEAAKVYDRNAKKYFGEFARLNFPDVA